MYDKYIAYLKIGIIKELTEQGVLTKEEEEKIIKQMESKYDIEV